MADYTDADRVAFIREMVVRYGFLPREIGRVMDDSRATCDEFDHALEKAMLKHGHQPAGVNGGVNG